MASTMQILSCLALSLSLQFLNCQAGNLEEIFQWRALEFSFPTVQDQAKAAQEGSYTPGNGIAIDVAPHYGSKGFRVFMTIARFQSGIPYSLATITGANGANGTILQAYPNYYWHSENGKDCDCITAAFRVDINECNQMWVIDSGMIEDKYFCPPQLLLFDLNTDQLVHRYRFSMELYIPVASFFITPLAVVRDPPPSGYCQQTKVYVADVRYHGLVVYDYQKNTAWRVENKYMYPDPNFGTHTLAGDTFTLMDGIFALASDKINLYFHPLASKSEYAVSLSVLDNQTIFANGPDAATEAFQPIGDRSSECGVETIDSKGNLYCVTFNPVQLVTWNVHTFDFGKNLRSIPANPELLEFVSGMKVVRNYAGEEELWMMSNRYQKIGAGNQSPNEINYRVVRLKIDNLGSIGQPNPGFKSSTLIPTYLPPSQSYQPISSFSNVYSHSHLLFTHV